MHRPGIEPGPPAWQASILPLNQRCLDEYKLVLELSILIGKEVSDLHRLGKTV